MANAMAVLPVDHYQKAAPLPLRRRKDSIDDLGGILSRFEAPLACRHLKSTGTDIPPLNISRNAPSPQPSFIINVKTIKGRKYQIPCSAEDTGRKLAVIP